MRIAPGSPDARDFAGQIIAKAQLAGVEASQVMMEGIESRFVAFDADGINTVGSAMSDQTQLTVFESGRRGQLRQTGRDHASIAGLVTSAIQAARLESAAEFHAATEPSAHTSCEFGDLAPCLDAVERDATRLVTELQSRFQRILLRGGRLEHRVRSRMFTASNGHSSREIRGSYRLSLSYAAAASGGISSFQSFSRSFGIRPGDLLGDTGLAGDLETALQLGPPLRLSRSFSGMMIIAPEALGFFVRALYQYLSQPDLDFPEARFLHPSFTLHNCPCDADFADGAAFDDDGYPTRDVTLIDRGVLSHAWLDSVGARRRNLPFQGRWETPSVAAGDRSLSEMIEAVPQGLLLRQYSGDRLNNDLHFSGLAKNSLLIRDGKIVGPAEDAVVSGNLRGLLSSIAAVSSEHVQFGDRRLPYVACEEVSIRGLD